MIFNAHHLMIVFFVAFQYCNTLKIKRGRFDTLYVENSRECYKHYAVMGFIPNTCMCNTVKEGYMVLNGGIKDGNLLWCWSVNDIGKLD